MKKKATRLPSSLQTHLFYFPVPVRDATRLPSAHCRFLSMLPNASPWRRLERMLMVQLLPAVSELLCNSSLA
jgi:hypothetical protein